MHTTKIGSTVFIHNGDFSGPVTVQDGADGRVEVPFSDLARAALESGDETVLLQGVLTPVADIRGLVGMRVIEDEVEALEQLDPAGPGVFGDPGRLDAIRRWA
jgi:hypothetical protein